MKIGIIGASGKAGSLIALEAKNRHHDVTAIVRDAKKMDGTGYTVLKRDLYDLTADDLKGFDVVVDAFGTAFDPQSAKAHQTSLKHLSDIMETLPGVRLMVVGGAASLYTDHTREHIVLESIPDQWKPVPENMKMAFDKLQQSSCKWTYFSPAGMFDAKGPRTGKYTSGTDFSIKNSEGEFYISYQDYAIAMLDEIEEGNFIGKRFTAVSEKTKDKDGYYGIEKKEPTFEGISRYRPHFNSELAGKNFHVVMDREEDFDIIFLTGTHLLMHQGENTYYEHYECAKGAELVYFVNFELANIKPRTNLTLILDLAARLITCVKTITNYKKQHPTLCESDYDFGALDVPGYQLPEKRHGYTTDLVGKRINWHYNAEFSIVHCYYHPRYTRATFTPDALKKLQPAPVEAQERWKNHPYDEPAVYVKIRDGLYVISFTEQSMARSGAVGNSLLFLMNTDRVHDIGRSFGHTGQFGGTGYLPENYLFGAYGEFVTDSGDTHIENDPPFYNI